MHNPRYLLIVLILVWQILPCSGDEFDTKYAAWRSHVLDEELLTGWEFVGPEAEDLLGMGPGILPRVLDKIRSEESPIPREDFRIQYSLQHLLSVLTGIELNEISPAIYSPQILFDNRTKVRAWPPDHFEQEIGLFSDSYKMFQQADIDPTTPITATLVNPHIYQIWKNGIYAWPFMIRKIRDDNSREFMLIAISLLNVSGDYHSYAESSQFMLPTKEEKIAYIVMNWERVEEGLKAFPDILLQAQELLEKPQFTLYAYHSMILNQNVTVTGDIGVREKQSDVTIGVPDTEITVLQNGSIAGNLYADSIVLQNNANVTGVVVSNELTTASGVVLTEPREATVVLPVINPVTDFLEATPGESAISVAHGETLSLTPGSYSSLNIESQATVELTTGTYHFQDVMLGESAKMITNGACEVRVAGRLLARNNSSISPISGSQLDAGDIQLFIAGMNGGTGALDATPKTVEIGNNCIIQARIVAPNGTLELGNGSNVQGVLVAKWLDIGQNCVITKQ